MRLSRLAVFALALAATPLTVEGQYFGRNKVQYRSFDFEVVRTEHFDIYYYAQEREAVLDAARMAERSYARLSRLLQHEFRERKPIILYASHADFQQTNALSGFIDESTGGVTEALKSRVILPFTGSYADFDHVLTHELVHAFQFDVILRRGVITDSNPFGGRLPLWFMEGMAEYLSIGRIDALTVSWLRDATLNGYLRDIGELSRRDDYLSYRFGQSLWQYIGSKWGDEVVGILLQKTPRMGIERAFATTLGITLEQLSEEWTARVRKTYLPQITDYAPPSQFAQKLTAHDRLEDPWFLAPAISPDGTRMVYLSQRDGFFFDLWLADARTGQPLHKLISASASADFESLRYLTSGATFSADGRYLAFAAQTGGRDALYVYDLSKRKVVRKLKLALDGIDTPSFSPDGQRIVFSGNVGGLSDLFVTDLAGKLTRLTQDRHADLTPAWSPDGRSIAFSTDRGPDTDFERLSYGNFRVALLSLADRSITILPDQDAGKNLNPVWSPDARALIWVNDATGTNNLQLYDLGTQRARRLTDVLSGMIAVKDISPVLSWSRSGRLLFTYFEKAGYNTYAVDDPQSLSVTSQQNAVAVANAATAPPGRPADPLPAWPNTRAPTTSYYRSGAAFRPSDERTVTESAQLPVSVVALLDSATMALPDTAAFEHRDYKTKLTPDIIGRPTIGAQVGGYYGNGVYGGSYVALSDMLGNHNLLLAGNVNGSLSDANFFAGYSFLKRRSNLSFALEQVPLYRYYGGDYMTLEKDGQAHDVFANIFVRDVIRTAAGYLSYPFSAFQRLELGASAVYYKSDVLYRGYDLSTQERIDHTRRIDDLSYVQPMAALVFDNSLFGWTGPIYGRRYRAQLSRTLGSFEFTEALLDFRNYWNFRQAVVLATRFTGLSRTGQDGGRFGMFWGGPYFIRGYDAGSFELDGAECVASRTAGTEQLSRCPIRDQLIGSSAAFANAELRVPVIKELQIGFLGAFPPVDLVTFFDGGLAWDGQVCARTSAVNMRRCAPDQAQNVSVVWQRREGQDPYLFRAPVFSYGAGLRMNVFYTVLRFDYTIPLSRPGRDGWRDGVFSISFGPSF